MIQQQHLTAYPKAEKQTGKRITMPGLAVNIQRAMQQYNLGDPVIQAKGWYEQQNMPIPDFDRMSKIDRLMALESYRKEAKAKTNLLDDLEKNVNTKIKEKELSNLINKKVNESKQAKE